ncbi:MAG: hypothetical protein HQM09_07670 [Candidatus Riflebacteria bacterium]|nr:hypothetical protein [Candidatus Riflebacteria bacterium]
MERYYRLKYTTPNPAYDGSKRWIEIVSSLKGQKDQGKGSYVAPSTPPQAQTVRNSGEGGEEKQSLKLSFNQFDLSGPDQPFLTGPITPPPQHPVFGANASNFLGLSPAAAADVIVKTEQRVRVENANNLKQCGDYLNRFNEHLNQMEKSDVEKASVGDLKEFEIQRIAYRKQILAKRRDELELYRKQSQEEHDVYLEENLSELALQRQHYVQGLQIPVNAEAEIERIQRIKLAGIEKKYDALRAELAKSEDAFDGKFEKARDNHVINERTKLQTIELPSLKVNTKTSNDGDEVDPDAAKINLNLPEIPNLSSGSEAPELKEIEK